MRAERWQTIEAIYCAALERDESARSAFVLEACGGDEDLRREVESLLEADGRAERFMEASAIEIEARATAAETPSPVGQQFGRYLILAPIDSGGMGEVYRARDLGLNRNVAVKVLPEDLARNSEGRARFLREAKAVAALSHPNVLSIHDFGNERGVWFAVTELLEGETLRARIQRSPLPWEDAAAIGAAIADGLAAVHGSGIVHRDLKPENIFLTSSGAVKILDFGIARMSRAPLETTATEETETAHTIPGTVLGTAGYMSPEQLSGKAVEAPSDIFSLGCVLYEAVTGKTPFARATTAETTAAILRDDPATLLEANRGIPLEFDRLVERCLDKQPEKRFSRAVDLASGLREILNGRAMPQRRAATFPSRRSVLLSAAAAIAFALTGFWAWRQSGTGPVIDSVAILPLVNDSGDPALEYLSDGITESLINSLSRLPGLKVSARTTVFHFKGKGVDVSAIGRQLGVHSVVTGRMILKGNELTIQADLVDVADGSQLWGERYQRKLSELPAVEQEIARQISNRLRPQLTGGDKRLTSRHPENSEVYRLYLQGRFFLNRATPESFQTAIGYFNKALGKDPAYALAYAGLADAYTFLGGFGVLPMRETHPRARTAATRALEIDETLAEAHTALASAITDYYWDWPEAEKHFQRALELEPDYALTHEFYAYYLARFRRFDEAVSAARRATELEPYSLIARTDLGSILAFAGRNEEAAAELRRTLEMDPEFGYAHFLLGLVLSALGRHQEALQQVQRSGTTLGDLGPLMLVQAASGEKKEALATIKEAERISRQQYIPATYFALAYAALGDRDRTIEWLEKAYQERHWLVTFLNVPPTYDLVREDPRFKDLVRRIGVDR
jgi:serine/threonine protein kinase/tetratricopeptide (TPR) repeat protein